MNNKNEMMIDIETLGTEDDCVIASIGVIIFNRSHTPGTYIREYEVMIDLESQPNRSIDAGTVLWWMTDSMEDARKAVLLSKNRVRLGLALRELDVLVKDYAVKDAWACSPSFDMKKLQSAYKQHNQPFPVPFWNWRDVRTLEDFFYGTNTRKKGKENWLEGLAHTAIDDCKMQVNLVQKCYMAATRVTM